MPSAPTGLGNKPLRGAMLGTGNVAIHHMRAWSIIAGVQIVALANRTRARAEKLGSEFGVAPRHIYADYRELLEREELDFVDVATAPDVHREQVLAAAARGIHVFCQKPFAPSLAVAQEMIAACEAAGVRCIVHENWRWRYCYRELKRRLAAGAVGTPRYARFQKHTDDALPRADGKTPNLLVRQSYDAALPHFIVFDSGIHLIDVMRFLFGDIERVYARMSRVSPLVRGEDMAQIVFEFASGVTGLIDISYGSRVPPERILARGRLDPFVVEGDRGTIELDPYRDESMIISTIDETVRYPVLSGRTLSEAYQESYFHTLSHFVRCLRTGEVAENDARDNLKTLAAVFAAYESATSHQVVTLDPRINAGCLP